VSDDAPDNVPTPRIEVRGGGAPTAEQLAALVVALTPTGGDAGASEPAPAIPAWAAAALREGVGGTTILEPGDLRELDPHG
jgi:hypothetical protein